MQVMRAFFCACPFCCLASLHAQTGTSQDSIATDTSQNRQWFDAKNAHVEYFTGNAIGHFISTDTSLDRFQFFNPARMQYFPYAYLGNLGAPAYPRFFTFDRQNGFDNGRHYLDLYTLDIDSLRYYRTNLPFTSLYYVLGSHSEQLFRVEHTQNFGPDCNIALHFDRLASDGFYTNNRRTYSNAALNSWFRAPGGRYSVYVAGVYDKIKSGENGGVVIDTVFSYPQQSSVEVFRDEASEQRNNWQAQVMQQVLFGRKETYATDDTTETTRFIPRFRLVLQSGYHHYYYDFDDPSFDRSYYDTIFAAYTDIDTLRDVSRISGFYNRLSFGNDTGIRGDSVKETHVRWETYMLQQSHVFSDASGRRQYRNLLAGGDWELHGSSDSAWIAKVTGDYDLLRSDFKVMGVLELKDLAFAPGFAVMAGRFSPTVTETHYAGFTDRWDAVLHKTAVVSGSIHVTVPLLKLQVRYTVTRENGYVYFAAGPEPAQGDIVVQQAVAEKDFHAGDFYFANRIAWQGGKREIVAFPTWLFNHSLYYQKHLFHSALFFQTGLDMWYCSDYMGYAYDIVTGLFTLRGDVSGAPLHFLPEIDAFMNFDIRTFRFFIQFDNIYPGLLPTGYYVAPHYPMQEAAFTLGLSWYLFY